ncbi:MAG: GNAT family N-acetyltransferase [Acidimicrobiales bacterium]
MGCPVVTVRTASSDDLVAILRLLAERDAGGRRSGEPSDLERRTWTQILGTAGLTVYLAEIEREAVGTATVMTMPNLTNGCAPTAFVEAVVVAVSHRRRGVATTIMRRILRDTRESGCNKVQLLSHKRHAGDGGHRLYAALGFQAEAEGFRLYHRRAPAAVEAATDR